MFIQALLLSLLTITAAIVGTVSGFGISSIMIPVMVLYYPLQTVLLFVALIHFSGDIWKMLLFRKGFSWRLVLGFGIPGIALSYVGATVTIEVAPEFLEQLLGGFLIIYVIFLLLKKRWHVQRTGLTAVAGGSLSGLFAGLFGVGGAVRSAFLAAYDLPKETYIFVSGAIAMFIDITRIVRYFTGGMGLPEDLALMLFILVPLSLLGAWVAKKLVDRVPQNYFRLVIAVMLGIMGIKYLTGL